MTYAAYLKFYGLKDTADNRDNWLYAQWAKGNLYKRGDKFFSIETGKEVK